jgi:hypothetical protein
VWPLVRSATVLLLVLVGLAVVGRAGWVLTLIDAAFTRTGVALPPVEPPDLDPLTVLLAALLGAAGSRLRPVAHAVTFLHELAHVLVATACGARPTGVVLRRVGGGHATYRSPTRGALRDRLYRAATAAAGYPAAAWFAAAGAGLLAAAGPRPVLWVLAAFALLVTALSRSPWAAVVSLGLGAIAVVALSERAEPYAAGVVVALTVALSLRNLTEDVRALRGRLSERDDARAVQAAIGLPARLLRVLQAAVTLASTGAVAWHLTGAVV